MTFAGLTLTGLTFTGLEKKRFGKHRPSGPAVRKEVLSW